MNVFGCLIADMIRAELCLTILAVGNERDQKAEAS